MRQKQVISEQDEDEDVDDLRELLRLGELPVLALLDASSGRKRATEEDDDSVDENSDTSNIQNKCVKTCSCTFPCCGEKNGLSYLFFSSKPNFYMVLSWLSKLPFCSAVWGVDAMFR